MGSIGSVSSSVTNLGNSIGAKLYQFAQCPQSMMQSGSSRPLYLEPLGAKTGYARKLISSGIVVDYDLAKTLPETLSSPGCAANDKMPPSCRRRFTAGQVNRGNRLILVDYEAVTGSRVQFMIFVILVGWL